MTYVMSDIHGCYEQYLKLLGLIGFSDGDDLFVLGDVVDRSKQPPRASFIIFIHTRQLLYFVAAL